MLNNFPKGVIADMSRRADGSMRLHGSSKELDAPAEENRRVWLKKLGISPSELVSARLVHGAHVEAVGAPKRAGVFIKDTDALVTDQKGVYLSVTNADCPTLYLYDMMHEAVGIAHCGWKGILAGVVEATVGKMVTEFDTAPRYLMAHIGPGIKSCHFEVGADVAAKFGKYAEERVKDQPILPYVDPNSGKDTWERVKKWYVDLDSAIIARLESAGVRRESVSQSLHCTYCWKGATGLVVPGRAPIEYQYFSARRDKSDPLQTQMAVIGIKR